MKDKLLKIFVLAVLAFGSICGMPINPKDVEELLAVMNQAKEMKIEEHYDNGDPDTTDGRKDLTEATAGDREDRQSQFPNRE